MTAIIVPPRAQILTEECCTRCKHALDTVPAGPQMICRRFPPLPFPIIMGTPDGPAQVGSVSNFPTVNGDMVCGEFARRVLEHKRAGALG